MSDSALEKILAADRKLKKAVDVYSESADRVTRAEVDGNGRASATSPTHDPWPVMAEEALHGLAGEFVKAVEPFSEADPVGILLHVLAGASCLIGSGPQFRVEHAPHFARVNILFVGRTAGGRKGTALSTPRHVFSQIDEAWVKNRVKSGLSSGEGLIFQVRDPRYEKRPIREAGKRTGEILGYEDVLIDPGEEDKRLLIIEQEFASTLKLLGREGNILSGIIRNAFDDGNLSPLTKKDPIKATDAHISIIGHATRDELLRYLTASERGNGFANRFLFTLVRRSKCISSGKGVPPEILEPYIPRFSLCLDKARLRGTMSRDMEAEQLWGAIYPKLGEEVPGLTGAILARAEAQVLRLSMIYSLLDEKEADSKNPAIRPPHLLAALAVWDYCKASVQWIFGDAIGDPVADRLLREIKAGPKTDTELYEGMGKRDGGRKDPALDLLVRLDLVHPIVKPTAGRSIREWHLGTSHGCVLCVKRV